MSLLCRARRFNQIPNGGQIMNWDAIGAIGEIVGAIAVVATLAYLARQMRDNSKQVKLNTTQSFASLGQDSFSPIYNTPETIRIWHVGTNAPKELDDIELATFYLFMDRVMNNALALVTHYESGVMSEAEFVHYRSMYQGFVATPGGRLWMAERRYKFPELLVKLDTA